MKKIVTVLLGETKPNGNAHFFQGRFNSAEEAKLTLRLTGELAGMTVLSATERPTGQKLIELFCPRLFVVVEGKRKLNREHFKQRLTCLYRRHLSKNIGEGLYCVRCKTVLFDGRRK